MRLPTQVSLAWDVSGIWGLEPVGLTVDYCKTLLAQ